MDPSEEPTGLQSTPNLIRSESQLSINLIRSGSQLSMSSTDLGSPEMPCKNDHPKMNYIYN